MRVHELLRRVATLGVVAAFALVAGNAIGQVSVEIVDETTTETVTETTIEKTMGGGEIEKTTETTIEETIESAIEKTIEAGLVLDINQSGNNTGSPHDNEVTVDDAVNSIEGGETTGVGQIQQMSGGANVSVATATFIDGDALIGILEIEVDFLDAGPVDVAKQKVLILTPALAFNSLYVTKLLTIESLVNGLAHAEGVIADAGGIFAEITHTGNNEWSPHHNDVAITADGGNIIEDFTGAGITQIQQAMGGANVALASVVVLFASESAADALAP